jgi:hypothetical protein
MLNVNVPSSAHTGTIEAAANTVSTSTLRDIILSLADPLKPIRVTLNRCHLINSCRLLS